jgi:hypothetical protein
MCMNLCREWRRKRAAELEEKTRASQEKHAQVPGLTARGICDFDRMVLHFLIGRSCKLGL